MGRRVNGTGSVWKDEARSKWRGRIVVHGTPHVVTGRTKRDVTEQLAAIRAEAAPTGYTVSKAAAEWMAVHVRPMCRRSTVEQYQYLLDKWLLPCIGELIVEDVRPRDVQGVIARMSEAGLSSKTMKHARTTLRAMYSWLVTNGIVESNPVTVRIPETETRPRAALSQGEVALVLQAMEHSRWIHSVRFALLTGLRRGELLALRWQDVEDGWISVHATRDKDGLEGPPKSRAGIRRIPMGKALQGILDDQRAMLALEGIVSSYVFPNRRGAAMSPGAYYTRLRLHARKVGIHVSVHELRHTFVSLAGRGVDIQALQLMLGHASATQTIDLYQHLTADVLQEAAAMVDSRAHLVSDVSVNVNQLSTYAGESKASRKRDARNPLHNPLQNEKSG